MVKHTNRLEDTRFIADHQVADNGVLHRRAFLKKGVWASAAVSTSVVADLSTPASWQTPGAGFSNYGVPPQDPRRPIRWISATPTLLGNGVSWTPLHNLEGSLTPTGLHFERHHNGVPNIEPDNWQVLIHGQVSHALSFSLDALHRYPLVSKICLSNVVATVTQPGTRRPSRRKRDTFMD